MSVRDYAVETARYIEDRLFKTMLPPEEVAAIFVEAIQGEGGYLPAPDEFMQELRRICDENGILLVCDEVQSGCGRTGKWWAIEHTGVEPDIITIAKGIASGMPLSVTLAKAHVMDWVPGSHASTFGGNPVCIAAALATLDVIEREGMKNAKAIGSYIMDRIREWPERYEIVGDVRGRGLMIGIEIVRDQQSKLIAGPERDRIIHLAFDRGVLVLGCGPNTIRLCPPLIVTREEADIALDIIEEAIRTVQSSAKPAEVVAGEPMDA